MIQLTLNGESHRFVAPLTCSELLLSLGLAGKRVALERNGAIVPRSLHESTRLEEGDQLEMVVAVGGG